jgi:tyrosinase
MKKINSLTGMILVLGWALAATGQEKCVIKPSEKPRVRVNATSAEGTEQLKYYAEGVKKMKTRPATDPTSWTYQAAMHGTYATPTKPLWNTCQHGSYFFLAWHRMYLYFFESIVRANSNPEFNLPYWDYINPSGPTDPRLQLPAQFRNTANPLYVADRHPSMNAGGFLPEGDVQTDYSMARMFFTCGPTNWASSFGGKQVPAPVHFTSGFGALESLPHNAVHDDVGGWMGDPNTAAQDPIFWLHHSNIDRLWDAWEKLDSGRKNNWDATWLDQKFYFYNDAGKQCYLTGKDVIDDAKQLGYRYDNEKVPVPPKPVNCPGRRPGPPHVLVEHHPANRITLGTTPVSIEVPLKETPERRPAAAEPRALTLTVDDIQFDKNPSVGYEIFLNLPQGKEANHKSDHYVGTIHFFGLKHSREEGHEAQLQFDVTSIVDSLEKQGQWKGQVKITFVPRGPREANAPATGAEAHVAGVATIGRVAITESD